MKFRIILCVLLLSLMPSLPSLFAQDHAPTVDQCRADQRLWSSGDANAFKDATSRLSLRALKQRSDEMGDCFAVDSERSHQYFSLVAAYATELSGRYKDFIDRHNLMAQFLAEDATGKR